jgi:hypothetical protein
LTLMTFFLLNAEKWIILITLSLLSFCYGACSAAIRPLIFFASSVWICPSPL